MNFSDDDIEKLLRAIYDGSITPTKLSNQLYRAIGNYLFDGVAKGVTSDIKFGTPDLDLVVKLRENVYLFSAAKTFHQTLEMSDALVDNKGELRGFTDFKEEANKIFVKYNGGKIDNVVKPGWLEAEYNTAIAQASSAKKWDDIEKYKHLFPYVRYNANGEACVICSHFNMMVFRVGDPILRKVAPRNHFNCNCLLEQMELEEGQSEETGQKEINKAVKAANIPDAFLFNPGVRQEVFSTYGESKHPYFTVPKQYEKFAQNNFNLKIPKS